MSNNNSNDSMLPMPQTDSPPRVSGALSTTSLFGMKVECAQLDNESALKEKFSPEEHELGKQFFVVASVNSFTTMVGGRIVSEIHEKWSAKGRESQFQKRLREWLKAYGAGRDVKTARRWMNAYRTFNSYFDDVTQLPEYFENFQQTALYELSKQDVPAEVRDQAIELAKHQRVTRATAIHLMVEYHDDQRLVEANPSDDEPDPTERSTDLDQGDLVPASSAAGAETTCEDSNATNSEVLPGDARPTGSRRKLPRHDFNGPDIRTDLARLIAEGYTAKTIYADPPWRYDNANSNGAAANHYETMSLKDLQSLPIEDVAADNAHLHLWTTCSFLPDALELIPKWGFEYKTTFVWIKERKTLGLGNYWRLDCELMLFATRGSLPFQCHDLRNWILCPPSEHSEKPEEIRASIEEVSVEPYLELFARASAPNWTQLGNQMSAQN